MADTPEVAFALVLEHGMDCPTCRTSDRLCDTGQELLRIHNAGRSDAALQPGAPGRCDCCGRDEELSTVHESTPTGPGRTRYVCRGCAPRPVSRDRSAEGLATVPGHAAMHDRQCTE